MFILLIDDDIELFHALDEYFKDEGFQCTHAPHPEQALAELRKKHHDVVILDVMLPHMNGIDLLRQIRNEEGINGIPILMLTARGEEIDKVLGLEMGADDYMSKPFSARELLARLRALYRRSQHSEPEKTGSSSFEVDDLAINQGSLSVNVSGIQKQLTPQEMRLLELLLESAGKIVDRDQLHRAIFGQEISQADNSLTMLVSRLRKKLGSRPDGGDRIKAIWGTGYMYLVSPESQ